MRLQVLGRPGEAHEADLFLYTGPRAPRQTRLVEESMATDAGVSARQANRTLTLALQIAMDVPLVFQVPEEPPPLPRRSELLTKLHPTILIQWEGFTLRVPPFGEDVRPITHGVEVHVERSAHRIRELVVIERKVQAEPDHFPPDEALLPTQGRVDADAWEVTGHRLIPSRGRNTGERRRSHQPSHAAVKDEP